MKRMELKFLEEDQNATFDCEYHTPEEIAAKVDAIRASIPGGPQTILDIAAATASSSTLSCGNFQGQKGGCSTYQSICLG
jgi:hypothetical protein